MRVRIMTQDMTFLMHDGRLHPGMSIEEIVRQYHPQASRELCIAYICGVNEGKKEGHIDGYKEGHADGRNECIEDRYYDGWADGYKRGIEEVIGMLFVIPSVVYSETPYRSAAPRIAVDNAEI